VNAGYDVIAVEPQEALRAHLRQQAPAADIRAGVAEEIPLPDGSVDAVTVDDAFHWFDRPRALAEIRRVLTPAGGLAILDNVPDWGGASWAHELGTLIFNARGEHPHFDGRPWQEYVREAPGFTDPWVVNITSSRPADLEGVLAHAASMSWIAAMADAERGALMERMRAIVMAGETPETFPLHVEVGLAALSDQSGVV
jgi:SAM-dependent methyltransferase